MTVITGIGYITKQACGGIRQGLSYECGSTQEAYAQLKEIGVLDGKVKNFGRFDDDSKRTLLISGLALRDAGIAYPLPDDHECGIILGNSDGALSANIDYFKDYVEGGRIISRGNLFVYTLPTSSIGEAAIYYGLRGPLLYVSNAEPLPTALNQASDIIVNNESRSMLAVATCGDDMLCFVLENISDDQVEDAISIDEFIEKFKATDDSNIMGFCWT